MVKLLVIKFPQHIALFVAFFSILTNVFAQEDITIKGKVKDSESSQNFPYLMVANQKTGLGFLGSPDGSFEINAKKNDTILISVPGYRLKKISFADSVYKRVYVTEIKISKLQVDLNPFEVKPNREFAEIKKDIEKLSPHNYQTYEFKYVSSDIYRSIIYLYTMFIKVEQSKRKLADLENKDAKDALMKELITLYIKGEIIELSPYEYQDFIDFCNFSDDFLRNASHYEIIMAVKSNYAVFRRYRPY